MGAVNYKIVTSHQELKDLVPLFMEQEAIGFDTETTGLDPYSSRVRLIQIATEDCVYIIDVWQVVNVECLRPLFEGEEVLKIGQNLKFDIKFMRTNFGIFVHRIFDTMLASQLLGNGKPDQKRKHGLDDIAYRYLGIELDKSQQKSDWSQAKLSEEQLIYAAKDVAILLDLCHEMIRHMKQAKLVEAGRLEFNACIATAHLELCGAYINTDMWMEMLDDMATNHEQLTASTKLALGDSNINLNSPVQLKKAFSNLGIPVEGTAEEVLLPLADEYPAVALLLDYREVQKLLSSYGKQKKKRKDGKEHFLELVHSRTGRVHAEFQQMDAESGRFSCRNPNIQQIPGLEKSMFRWAFRAQYPNRKIIVSDYSQVELRILADFANDTGLIEAFLTGEDIHKATAALVYGVSIQEVTKSMRKSVKSVNFGLAYGRGAMSLANQMGCSLTEAKDTLQKWKSRLWRAWDWLYSAGQMTVRQKMCRTASGRIRYFEFDPRDQGQRASVERYGKNTPIQGTSADITKLAMWELYKEFKDCKDILMTNTVHDELVFEAPADIADDVSAKIQQIMESAGNHYIKKVPIIADPKVCDSWAEKDAEAHHLEAFLKRFPAYK